MELFVCPVCLQPYRNSKVSSHCLVIFEFNFLKGNILHVCQERANRARCAHQITRCRMAWKVSVSATLALTFRAHRHKIAWAEWAWAPRSSLYGSSSFSERSERERQNSAHFATLIRWAEWALSDAHFLICICVIHIYTDMHIMHLFFLALNIHPGINKIPGIFVILVAFWSFSGNVLWHWIFSCRARLVKRVWLQCSTAVSFEVDEGVIIPSSSSSSEEQDKNKN